jgi:hypothetical protein
VNPISGLERLVSKNLEKIAVQSRALVVVAGIVAIVAIGLVVVVDDQVGRVVGLGVFLALMLVVTILLYLTSRATGGGGENTDHAAVAGAVSSVNGRWWQLVVNDQTPGLSVIDIDLSVLPNRHRLRGTKYTPQGTAMATWKSRAVGLMSIEPVEVFYYWRGAYSDAAGAVSGIGLFEFDFSADARADRGTGWFTTGDVERGDFSRSSKVHLRPVDAQELPILSAGGAESKKLIRSRYTNWLRELEI